MIINGPQPVLSLAELPLEQVVVAVEVWRERMRAHASSAYLQLIVNERREAGASLPHTHAQLYALDFVPAAVARERERASAYTTRTMGQSLLGDLVAEEVRRRERIVAIDEEAVLMAPYASRLPFQLMLAPRTPRPRFEEHGPLGRGAAARRPAPAGAPPRLEPAAEPVGAHGAARRGGLLLADRRDAAPDASRGARALDRREPQHRRPRARRGGAARRVGWPAAMPPEERFVPRFAAEPPQEELPYGRWEERLREEFLGAALRLDGGEEDLGEPGGIAWYPDRTWHGRTYVPATALTSSGYELFGYVRFVPGGDDGEPSDFSAHVDFTEETAERNPDWKLDLCDEVIGSWRGEAGAVGGDDARVGAPAASPAGASSRPSSPTSRSTSAS